MLIHFSVSWSPKYCQISSTTLPPIFFYYIKSYCCHFYKYLHHIAEHNSQFNIKKGGNKTSIGKHKTELEVSNPFKYTATQLYIDTHIHTHIHTHTHMDTHIHTDTHLYTQPE